MRKHAFYFSSPTLYLSIFAWVSCFKKAACYHKNKGWKRTPSVLLHWYSRVKSQSNSEKQNKVDSCKFIVYSYVRFHQSYHLAQLVQLQIHFTNFMLFEAWKRRDCPTKVIFSFVGNKNTCFPSSLSGRKEVKPMHPMVCTVGQVWKKSYRSPPPLFYALNVFTVKLWAKVCHKIVLIVLDLVFLLSGRVQTSLTYRDSSSVFVGNKDSE